MGKKKAARVSPQLLRYGDLNLDDLADLTLRVERCLGDFKALSDAMRLSGLSTIRMDGVTQGLRATKLLRRFADNAEDAILEEKRRMRDRGETPVPLEQPLPDSNERRQRVIDLGGAPSEDQ
jgi:hypothetical protein